VERALFFSRARERTFGQVGVTVKRLLGGDPGLLGADPRRKYSRWRKRNRPKSELSEPKRNRVNWES
jgi:hypothetical protein